MILRNIADFPVSAIGLGAMPMSIEGRPDEAQSIRTIHAALDAGVRLIDTANSYHLLAGEVGHNERLIAKALGSWSGDVASVLVATKGGHLRPGDGTWTQNGDPAYLIAAAKQSAKDLGVDAIGLYYYHRPDPQVPYAESIGALVELLESGVIVRAGISNASIEQINLANELLGGRLAAVQNEFSPRHRSTIDTLRECQRLGIAFLPWSPLGGIGSAKQLGDRHSAFHQVAANHDVSAQQVALAWELALGDRVIPIPGASRPESILDSIKAVDLQLDADELELLGQE
ncbi:MAG: aldo/keto reductase [Propionibacteriaceae bacterium]|jgi:aryl-alcohol dehydrogenase-like predicted oxidoreductase|nr:aldo/keto reductase [Propionibacteriaceae bacterium]